jgi:hypothetical protein
MKRYGSSRLLLGIAVLSLVCVAYGGLGGLQPFRATIYANEVFYFHKPPSLGIFRVEIDGTGSGAHFVRLTLTATGTIDFVNPGTATVTDGEFTITGSKTKISCWRPTQARECRTRTTQASFWARQPLH